MNTTAKTTNYLFGDDYVDTTFDAPKQIDEARIRREANMANGGEAALAPCPKCGGGGQTRWGMCFKCKGKGRVGIRVAAAAKGKQTKLANQAQWQADHADDIAYARKRAAKGNNFYAGLLDKLTAYGTLTEGQLGIITRDRAKDAEFFKARDAARPVIPTDALEALFNRPEVQKLARTPIFRTVDITIKKAPATGVNPGALYVNDTATKEYLGKIVAGKWTAKWGARDVTEALKAVAADPTAEAIKYANKFKACCCCGATLRNPVSVLAVVGPICGPRWGLDHLRMEAAAMLAAEAEKEAEHE